MKYNTSTIVWSQKGQQLDWLVQYWNTIRDEKFELTVRILLTSDDAILDAFSVFGIENVIPDDAYRQMELRCWTIFAYLERKKSI